MQNKKTKQLLILVLTTVILAVLYIALLRPFILKLRYKLSYEDSILFYSQEFEIDPSLVAAVIFCESGYNPNAISRVGAMGLMQLMPATAKEIAQYIGMEDYSDDMLRDPETSIKFGCYYLSQMMSEFSSVTNTLSAYNAGPGRTRGWIKNYGVNENNELLYIPYPETEKYVTRVTSAQKVYKALYPQLVIEIRKETI